MTNTIPNRKRNEGKYEARGALKTYFAREAYYDVARTRCTEADAKRGAL